MTERARESQRETERERTREREREREPERARGLSKLLLLFWGWDLHKFHDLF